MEMQIIRDKIWEVRGQKVMLDFDLAELYGVPTKVLKQAVRRNITRFPEDFLFELTQKEFSNLWSQIVTTSWGGTRYPPFAFTEQGVAMLSSVLRSEKAIQANIAIMRAFVALRSFALTYRELAMKLHELEARLDHRITDIQEALNLLSEEHALLSTDVNALREEHESNGKNWNERDRIGFKK